MLVVSLSDLVHFYSFIKGDLLDRIFHFLLV